MHPHEPTETAPAIAPLRDELLGPITPDEDLEDYRLRSYRAWRQAHELVTSETTSEANDPTSTLGMDEATLAHRTRLTAMSRTLSALDAHWTEPTPTQP